MVWPGGFLAEEQPPGGYVDYDRQAGEQRYPGVRRLQPLPPDLWRPVYREGRSPLPERHRQGVAGGQRYPDLAGRPGAQRRRAAVRALELTAGGRAVRMSLMRGMV